MFDRMMFYSPTLEGDMMNPSVYELLQRKPYGDMVFSYINTHLYSAIVLALESELTDVQRRNLSIMMSEDFLYNEVYRKSLVTRIAYFAINASLEWQLSSIKMPHEVVSLLEKNISNRLIAENAAIFHMFAYDDMRNASISEEVSSGGRK